MSRLKRLIQEIHQRSLWQVLGISDANGGARSADRRVEKVRVFGSGVGGRVAPSRCWATGFLN